MNLEVQAARRHLAEVQALNESPFVIDAAKARLAAAESAVEQLTKDEKPKTVKRTKKPKK